MCVPLTHETQNKANEHKKTNSRKEGSRSRLSFADSPTSIDSSACERYLCPLQGPDSGFQLRPQGSGHKPTPTTREATRQTRPRAHVNSEIHPLVCDQRPTGRDAKARAERQRETREGAGQRAESFFVYCFGVDELVVSWPLTTLPPPSILPPTHTHNTHTHTHTHTQPVHLIIQ